MCNNWRQREWPLVPSFPSEKVDVLSKKSGSRGALRDYTEHGIRGLKLRLWIDDLEGVI